LGAAASLGPAGEVIPHVMGRTKDDPFTAAELAALFSDGLRFFVHYARSVVVDQAVEPSPATGGWSASEPPGEVSYRHCQ
jgi:hypothetical protein